MTPEGIIKLAICQYLVTRKDIIRLFWVTSSVGIYDATRGCYRKSNSAYQINGVSDILGILNGGRFLAIEVKSKRGVLTIEQKIFLEEINHAGGIAFMAKSVDDVISQLPKSS